MPLILITRDLRRKYSSKTLGSQPLVYVLQLEKQFFTASKQHNWKATSLGDLKLKIRRDLTEAAGLQMKRADPNQEKKIMTSFSKY